FITSEGELPSDLEQFRIKIPYHQIHDALYYCTLLFGESATMASEAGVLGTPSIFINDIELGYINDQISKYALISQFKNENNQHELALEKAIELIKDNTNVTPHKLRSKEIQENCIDLTKFMVGEVLKYNKKSSAQI